MSTLLKNLVVMEHIHYKALCSAKAFFTIVYLLRPCREDQKSVGEYCIMSVLESRHCASGHEVEGHYVMCT